MISALHLIIHNYIFAGVIQWVAISGNSYFFHDVLFACLLLMDKWPACIEWQYCTISGM